MTNIITPDALALFDCRPAELALYEALAERLLARFPDMEIRAKKTQIGFFDRRMFACVTLTPVRRKAERPERFITVSFGLAYPLASPRVVPVRVRANRWTHHVIVGDVGELDGELLGWLDEAHSFAARSGR